MAMHHVGTGEQIPLSQERQEGLVHGRGRERKRGEGRGGVGRRGEERTKLSPGF